MAIDILKQPEGGILNAYNNSVFEFTSTNLNQSGLSLGSLDSYIPISFLNTVRAVVSVNSAVKIELQAINDKFHVNLKEVIKMLINRNNFADEVSIPSSNVFTHFDSSLYFEASIKFEITLVNGTKETKTVIKKYLKSVEQIIQPKFNYIVQHKIKLLLPYTNQTAYAVFWEEEPFDIALFSNINRSVKIRNKRTFVETTISVQKGVNRIYISNGMNDDGFENQIPLMVNHINELEFIVDNEVYLTLNLEKFSFECGTYLKWFNTSGGWSYWKFNPVEISSLNSKTDLLINKDFENITEASANYSVVTKSISQKVELKTGMLSIDQQKIVETIQRSPKVFLLSNNPYQNLSVNDFKEVKISDSTLTINNKPNNRELKIVVDMPNQYVQNYAS